jgi:hypothetical protein
MTRQHLIDKGLAYATEDYGHVDFTVPRFDEAKNFNRGGSGSARLRSMARACRRRS